MTDHANTVPTIGYEDALAVVMPPATPKPTSLDGQVESVHMLWTSPDGITETGLWECTPGTFIATRVGYDEVCQILTGRSTVIGDDGVTLELVPGSSFVTPEGWTGKWIIHETTRKLFVIRNFSGTN